MNVEDKFWLNANSVNAILGLTWNQEKDPQILRILNYMQDEIMCIKHQIAEYESADIPIIHGKAELEEHNRQIRADAIDEMFLMIMEAYHSDTLDECELCRIEKQLKEKK